MYHVNESPHKGCLYVCVLRFSKILCVLFCSVHTLLPPSLLRLRSAFFLSSCVPLQHTPTPHQHTLCAGHVRQEHIRLKRQGVWENYKIWTHISNKILHMPGLAVHPTAKKTHDFQLIRLKKHQIALKTLCLTLLGTLSGRLGRVLRYS